MSESVLRLNDLSAFYGDSQVLFNLSLDISEGEFIGLFGRNGMGKTTLLRSILNQTVNTTGTIMYHSEDVSNWPTYKIARTGIGFVPEGREIYSELSVKENLQLAMPRGLDSDERTQRLSTAYDRFPRLDERREQDAGTMSGGEQQMIAIARALVQEPDLLLLDEPTEGLAPVIVKEVIDRLRDIAGENRTIVMVEQNISQTLSLIDRGYILENGRIMVSGDTETLGEDSVQQQYLSI